MVTVAKSFEAPIKCKLSKQRERERERERAFTPFLARILVEQTTLLYSVLLHLRIVFN